MFKFYIYINYDHYPLINYYMILIFDPFEYIMDVSFIK